MERHPRDWFQVALGTIGWSLFLFLVQFPSTGAVDGDKKIAFLHSHCLTLFHKLHSHCVSNIRGLADLACVSNIRGLADLASLRAPYKS